MQQYFFEKRRLKLFYIDLIHLKIIITIRRITKRIDIHPRVHITGSGVSSGPVQLFLGHIHVHIHWRRVGRLAGERHHIVIHNGRLGIRIHGRPVHWIRKGGLVRRPIVDWGERAWIVHGIIDLIVGVGILWGVVVLEGRSIGWRGGV